MASDKMRALMAFVKFLVAVAVGYGIYWVWAMNRGASVDAPFVPFVYGYDPAPYLAGLIAAIMVFVLLSKLNKGSGE